MSERYEKALAYLYGFANLEHRRIDQYAPENISLSRPARLLASVGDPHKSYPSIHIAGTKGKGSVAAMCAEVLRQSGYRVGLYTSPHLMDFRDRVRVLTPDDGDGRISQEQVVTLVERLKKTAAEVPNLTWYELITTLGFLHFADRKVDIAVVEVGLGGRLDATNLLTPLVSVITSLSLDHTYLLGDTLGEIAAEKGGIIKQDVPVVTAPQPAEARDRLKEIAAASSSNMIEVGRDWQWHLRPVDMNNRQPAGPLAQTIIVTKSPSNAIIQSQFSLQLALTGRHQQTNAVVALAALNEVRRQCPRLSPEAIQRGLASVQWPGRLQILSQGESRPTLLVDCAHNVDSAQKLVEALKEGYRFHRLWLIVGITVDKDIEGILKTLLPVADRRIVTASSHPRAAEPEVLARFATDLGFSVKPIQDVVASVLDASRLADPGDLICVTGSIFVVGDLLNQWEGLKSQLEKLHYHKASAVKATPIN